jgi:phosphotriesterase-related protein
MAKGMIQTITGDVAPKDWGVTLTHEHLFTDLRGPTVLDYGQGDPEHVAATLLPYLEEAADLGSSALIEYSTMGVGRNPAILKKLGEVSPLKIIAPTGVYREAYVPEELKTKTIPELVDMWTHDITTGIDGTDLKAGFIKMSVSDEGITELEAKHLQAAVLTSQRTGAIVASHTIGGQLAKQEINLLADYGLDLNRFIWTHAQSETDEDYHLWAVERGVYISIDAIGSGWASDDDMLHHTLNLIEKGYTNRILLSHDGGWYDPSQPDGQPPDGGIRGFTALFKEFIPALKANGVSAEIIATITIRNPAEAFTLHN